MLRVSALLITFAIALSACAPAPAPQRLGPDGFPLPKVYRIAEQDTARIQFEMLDAINTLRQAAGVAPVRLNAALNAAAATHSRDMANQNRPWHFGSDGSSPIDRARRVGYPGRVLGENISETYETEIITLGAWMDQTDTREVILDRAAVDLGFAWFQEESGKIWWTMMMGG